MVPGVVNKRSEKNYEVFYTLHSFTAVVVVIVIVVVVVVSSASFLEKDRFS